MNVELLQTNIPTKMNNIPGQNDMLINEESNPMLSIPEHYVV